jgi:hypothetical protein
VVVAAFFVYGPAGLLVAGAVCLGFEFSMRARDGRNRTAP